VLFVKLAFFLNLLYCFCYLFNGLLLILYFFNLKLVFSFGAFFAVHRLFLFDFGCIIINDQALWFFAEGAYFYNLFSILFYLLWTFWMLLRLGDISTVFCFYELLQGYIWDYYPLGLGWICCHMFFWEGWIASIDLPFIYSLILLFLLYLFLFDICFWSLLLFAFFHLLLLNFFLFNLLNLFFFLFFRFCCIIYSLLIIILLNLFTLLLIFFTFFPKIFTTNNFIWFKICFVLGCFGLLFNYFFGWSLSSINFLFFAFLLFLFFKLIIFLFTLFCLFFLFIDFLLPAFDINFLCLFLFIWRFALWNLSCF